MISKAARSTLLAQNMIIPHSIQGVPRFKIGESKWGLQVGHAMHARHVLFVQGSVRRSRAPKPIISTTNRLSKESAACSAPMPPSCLR